MAKMLHPLGGHRGTAGQGLGGYTEGHHRIGAADVEKVLFEILEISERELRRTSLDDLRRAIATYRVTARR